MLYILTLVFTVSNVRSLFALQFPTQLLVIIICFTYACICPIILPVGAIFFAMALIVYKKQLLYVYTPVYESGGALFPDVCQKTLGGLICGQLTFIGYTIIRGSRYEVRFSLIMYDDTGYALPWTCLTQFSPPQPLFLLPLPFFTLWVMGYFNENYAKPSKQLSMERAKECDRISDLKAARRRGVLNQTGQGADERRETFDKSAYRQPVLTVHAMLPMDFRAGEPDPVTEEVRRKLQDAGRYEFMSERSAGLNGTENPDLSENSLAERNGDDQASLRNVI